jgi:prevent-host-death family protein
MKTMAAGKFKAQCLSVIDDVHDLKEEVIITKHGKPMAKLIPIKKGTDNIFGAMRGLGKITGDLVEPITPSEDWDAEVFPSKRGRKAR